MNRAGYLWGLLSAALGAAYFCTGSWLVKSVAGMGVREFTLVVYAWATLFAGVNALVTHRGKLARSAGEHRALLVLGGIWGVQVALAFLAAKLMDTGSAAALFRTSLLFTLVLAFTLLGERLSGPELAAGALITAGVFVLAAGSKGSAGWGPHVAMASALCASLYQLTAKRALASVPPAVMNFYRNLYVCVVFGGAAALSGWRPREASGTAHAAIALAAFLGPFLHSHSGLKSLANMPLVHAALVAQTQPLFVFLFAFLALGEMPGVTELAADALVLLGAMGLAAAGARKAAARPAP